MILKTVSGTYGGSRTECDVFAMTMDDGTTWYCIDGSTNVNCTTEDIDDGVNTEEVADHDFFTATNPVESEEDLEREVTE